jgi:hypothetical protein
MNAIPLSLNDLQTVTVKEAVTQNAVLTATAKKIYQLTDTQFVLTLGELNTEALKVSMQFNGQNIVLGLSESLVNVLVKDEGGQLSELNEELLALIIRLKLIPLLPAGTDFKGAYLTQSTIPENLAVLPLQVCLQAKDPISSESLGWNVSIYALPQTSLSVFLKSFDFLAVGLMPSPLLKASIPMPIVAAQTSVSAEQLLDLAIGDVILIN